MHTPRRKFTFPWGDFELIGNSIKTNIGICELNYQENIILKELLNKPNNPVPKRLFQYALWGYEKENSRIPDIHVSSLRKKIMSIIPKNTSCPIQTIRNIGYQFVLVDNLCIIS